MWSRPHRVTVLWLLYTQLIHWKSRDWIASCRYLLESAVGVMAKEEKAKSKSKKSKESNKDGDKVKAEPVPYEVRMKAVTVISKPMASQKQVRSTSS